MMMSFRCWIFNVVVIINIYFVGRRGDVGYYIDSVSFVFRRGCITPLSS